MKTTKKKESADAIVNVASKFDATTKFETLASKINSSMLTVQNTFAPPAVYATLASANKVAQMFSNPVAEATLSGLTIHNSHVPSSYQQLNVGATTLNSSINTISPLSVAIKNNSIGNSLTNDWEKGGLYATVVNPINKITGELNRSFGVVHELSSQINDWRTSDVYVTRVSPIKEIMTEVKTSLGAVTLATNSLNDFLSPVKILQPHRTYLTTINSVSRLTTEIQNSMDAATLVGTSLNVLSSFNDWKSKEYYTTLIEPINTLTNRINTSIVTLKDDIIGNYGWSCYICMDTKLRSN